MIAALFYLHISITLACCDHELDTMRNAASHARTVADNVAQMRREDEALQGVLKAEAEYRKRVNRGNDK